MVRPAQKARAQLAAENFFRIYPSPTRAISRFFFSIGLHGTRRFLSPQAHWQMKKEGRKSGDCAGGLYKGASIERTRCVHQEAGREADSLLGAVAARFLGE